MWNQPGDANTKAGLLDALQPICRTYGVDLCLASGETFNRTEQDGVTVIQTDVNDGKAEDVGSLMAIRIEGDTLTCDMYNVQGNIVDRFTQGPSAPQ